MRGMPTLAEIRAVPKVLLHDHLDGGLRPRTVLELARDIGYEDLPGGNAEELTKRLTEGAHRGHLEIYLDAFRHTVAVMQTTDALRRVAADGDRRARGPAPGRGRGRLRHRRRRSGLAAEQAPGRVPVPEAGELPLH